MFQCCNVSSGLITFPVTLPHFLFFQSHLVSFCITSPCHSFVPSGLCLALFPLLLPRLASPFLRLISSPLVSSHLSLPHQAFPSANLVWSRLVSHSIASCCFCLVSLYVASSCLRRVLVHLALLGLALPSCHFAWSRLVFHRPILSFPSSRFVWSSLVSSHTRRRLHEGHKITVSTLTHDCDKTAVSARIPVKGSGGDRREDE